MPRTARSLFARPLTLAALGFTALVASPTVASAQDTFVVVAPAKSMLDDYVSEWASLERPLLNVTGITDLQRDAIELLEERYRKQFNEEAQKLRQARLTLLQRGPFERHTIDLAIQRMAELRKTQLAQLRTVLTEAQHVPYDAMLKKIAEAEKAAEMKRERDAAFYNW